MVRRLLAAGHQVKVWNRSAAKTRPLEALGAEVATTPREAATEVEGVLMCLFDAEAAQHVVFGPEGVDQAKGLKWLVDHSSIAPQATRELAQRLKASSGADWIDAPVSGGVAGVEAGNLTVMTGGAQAHMAQATAVIRAYASHVTHMGPSGAGQITKLCNQTIVATTVAAIAEAIALAERNGIDGYKLATALKGGWADSKPLQVFVPRMTQVQPQSIGALATMLKDVDNVMTAAQASDTPLPLMATVQQQLRAACAAGLGQAELSAICALFDPTKRDAFMRQIESSRGG